MQPGEEVLDVRNGEAYVSFIVLGGRVPVVMGGRRAQGKKIISIMTRETTRAFSFV